MHNDQRTVIEGPETVKSPFANGPFFSSGQVARQLGISTFKVRALCETETIAAELTAGGQWRIPASEVMRLKKEGVPIIPRPMPANDVDDADEPAMLVDHGDHRQSSAVAAAAEKVEVLRHQAEALAIRKQVEEELDWFRERARIDNDQREAHAEAQRRAANQAQREHQRAAWLVDLQQRSLKLIPADAPGDAPQKVQAAVADALATMRTDESARVVERLVGGIVDRILEPWRLQQRVRQVIYKAAALMRVKFGSPAIPGMRAHFARPPRASKQVMPTRSRNYRRKPT